MKEKIAATKGDTHAKELQKLIYNGKILEDAQKLSELNIDEKKFVVVMVSRVSALLLTHRRLCPKHWQSVANLEEGRASTDF